MKKPNPFLCSERNPCRENPVTILDARSGSTQASIRLNAQMMEQMLSAGERPSEIALVRGQCIAAAQQLQEPVQRLAFTLLTRGFTSEQEGL